MKHLVIISGKGGTGKTTLAASFCALADNPVILDCDVDASNMHLLLSPKTQETYDFYGGKYAYIDKDKCSQCNICAENCRFEAIGKPAQVNKFLCEGCELCSHICPSQAISMKERLSGQWFISQTHYGDFIHARLEAGEENSGKLVSKIKQEAFKIAKEKASSFIIADGPPGIGCPVAASLSSADLAIIVCEPTLSAIYDMKRVIETAKLLNVPCAAIINKWDLNKENSTLIQEYCRQNNIPVLGVVSFSTDVTKSIESGVPLSEFYNRKLKFEVIEIWTNILFYLERNK